jgi:hypothetical protein
MNLFSSAWSQSSNNSHWKNNRAWSQFFQQLRLALGLHWFIQLANFVTWQRCRKGKNWCGKVYVYHICTKLTVYLRDKKNTWVECSVCHPGLHCILKRSQNPVKIFGFFRLADFSKYVHCSLFRRELPAWTEHHSFSMLPGSIFLGRIIQNSQMRNGRNGLPCSQKLFALNI